MANPQGPVYYVQDAQGNFVPTMQGAPIMSMPGPAPAPASMPPAPAAPIPGLEASQFFDKSQPIDVAYSPADPFVAPKVTNKKNAPLKPLPMPERAPQQGDAGAFFQDNQARGAVSGPAGAFGINIPASKGLRDYRKEVQSTDFADTEQEALAPITDIFKQASQSNEELSKELAQTMAPDYAVQAGEQLGVGQALAYQQRAIQERARVINSRMEDMSLGLQYPGASMTDVKQWKNVLDTAGADDPRSLGPTFYRQYVTAAENLRKAQELPSVEPKGFKRAVNAIALALGAFGASLTKTPNFAQQYIENALDREVARQKEEYERKKVGYNTQSNLYAQVMGEFKDSVASSQIARSLLKDNMAMYLEKAGLTQQAQKMRLENQQTKLKLSSDIASMDEARNLAGVQLGAQMASSQQGPDPVKEGPAKDFSDAINSVRVWNELEKQFTATNPTTFVDKMLAAVPFGLTKENRYEAIRQWALPQLASAKMGRLTDRDVEMLDKFIVQAGKNPEAAKQLFYVMRRGAYADVVRSIESVDIQHGDVERMKRMATKLLGPRWHEEGMSGFRTEDFGAQADPGAQ